MFKFLFLISTACLFASSVAHAEEMARCAQFRSTDDVVACIDSSHPESKKLEANLTEADGILKMAEQFPNPTLSFDTFKGKSLGDTQGETNLGVSQLVEIGGKRSARKKLSDASIQRLNANAVMVRDRLKIDAILKLVRYRQVSAEIAVLEETLGTYDKVNKQFSNRPRLSPDQRASATIFRLALGDYKHRLATLTAERSELEVFFRAIQNFDLESAKAFLPKIRKSWPDVNSNAEVKDGPRFSLLDSTLKEATANYDLQAANAWPDPTVSFFARDVVSGSTDYRMYGLGVSLPLPFWNLNGGGKAQALAQKMRAEVDYQTATRTLPLQYENLMNSYRNDVAALRQSTNFDESERQHRETEKLFYEGSIAGSQIIELHRQLLDFTTTTNELESHALESLLTLMSYQGRLKEFRFE